MVSANGAYCPDGGLWLGLLAIGQDSDWQANALGFTVIARGGGADSPAPPDLHWHQRLVDGCAWGCCRIFNVALYA